MKKTLLIFALSALFSCEKQTVEPNLIAVNSSDAKTGPIDFKLKLKDAEIIYTLKNNFLPAGTYQYRATVVPRETGVYELLHEGFKTLQLTDKRKPVDLDFNIGKEFTYYDGFYLELYQNGELIGYYRVNEYLGGV